MDTEDEVSNLRAEINKKLEQLEKYGSNIDEESIKYNDNEYPVTCFIKFFITNIDTDECVNVPVNSSEELLENFPSDDICKIIVNVFEKISPDASNVSKNDLEKFANFTNLSIRKLISDVTKKKIFNDKVREMGMDMGYVYLSTAYKITSHGRSPNDLSIIYNKLTKLIDDNLSEFNNMVGNLESHNTTGNVEYNSDDHELIVRMKSAIEELEKSKDFMEKAQSTIENKLAQISSLTSQKMKRISDENPAEIFRVDEPEHGIDVNQRGGNTRNNKSQLKSTLNKFGLIVNRLKQDMNSKTRTITKSIEEHNKLTRKFLP